jgi:hypothetical protein
MINPQWGFNPIIIRILFVVTLFQHLWIDCTQEELRLRNRGVEDSSEENHALALHTKKGG